MNREDFDYVQSSIGYHFKNRQLLIQAFTRKSYSQEHPESQDNEVMEFYGDAILDLYVTKQLYKKFSKIIKNQLVSEKNEDELTKLKSIIVSKNSLANCVYKFGLSKFLYLGNSDVKNEVWKTASVNEDLFEAIIGAVAIDCDWDFVQLEKVCKLMLQMETVNDYLVVLVKGKSHALGFGEPIYHPMGYQIEKMEDMHPFNLWEMRFGSDEFSSGKNPKTGFYEYWIDIGGNKFKGEGEGAFLAKLDADRKAYHFLCQEEIKRDFSNLDYENPASTLHELFQKKIIMEVRYEFIEYHDENGNPIWNCKAFLEGYGEFSADNVSKKQAKQDVSLKVLHFITDTVIEKSDKWDIPHFYSGLTRFWTDEEKAKHEAEFNKVFPNWGQ